MHAVAAVKAHLDAPFDEWSAADATDRVQPDALGRADERSRRRCGAHGRLRSTSRYMLASLQLDHALAPA